jgi:hypothetical protein
MGVNSTCWRDKKQKGKKNIILDTIFGWLGFLLQPLLFLLLNSNPPPPYLPLDSCAVVVVVCVPFHPELIEISGTGEEEPEKLFFKKRRLALLV